MRELEKRYMRMCSGGGLPRNPRPGSPLVFLAEISITLGLVNLLPGPGLDGAQIIFELAQSGRRG
jgi:hypothetical protein